MSDHVIELLKHQHGFVTTKAKSAAIIGGGGSGKTFGGAHYSLKTSIEYPDATGGIFANTYRQLQDATLPPLLAELDRLGIKHVYKENKGVLLIRNTKIFCRSLENYEAHRGIELGWYWIDEACYAKKQARQTLLGRLRDKRGPLQERLTSTPKGYDWVYELSETKKLKLYRARTADNVFLPTDYEQTLLENYDSKLIAQEVGGEFINIFSGQIYYAFDRNKNVQEFEQLPNIPLVVGMDFNVDPMTAVICQVYDNKVWVLDEFVLDNSNTDEMSKRIVQKYSSGLTVIPDATGKALKTSSAGLTDHEILRQYGFNIPRVHNPYTGDRYNCMNNLLDKIRLVIHPRCRNTIKDLERVSYREGTRDMDVSDKKLGHVSDALGYVCWYHFPIQIERMKTRISRYA